MLNYNFEQVKLTILNDKMDHVMNIHNPSIQMFFCACLLLAFKYLIKGFNLSYSSWDDNLKRHARQNYGLQIFPQIFPTILPTYYSTLRGLVSNLMRLWLCMLFSELNFPIFHPFVQHINFDLMLFHVPLHLVMPNGPMCLKMLEIVSHIVHFPQGLRQPFPI